MNVIQESKITCKYDNVMISESLYSISLYIYIMKGNIRNTLFIIGNNIIKASILNKLDNYVVYSPEIVNSKLKDYILLSNNIVPRKFKEIHNLINKASNFYGSDHSRISFLMPSGEINLIEDGVVNYIYYQDEVNLYNIIKKFFNIPLKSQFYGNNKRVKNIYLTKIMEIPLYLEHKVSILNRNLYFKSLPSLLDSVFSGSIPEGNNYQLLITQPLSEEGTLSENEKIKIYKEIINSELDLIIKPHPRERTDYSKYFPEAIVIKSEVLAESLFENDSISEIVTLFSSAILSYPFRRKVKVKQIGSKIDIRISIKYGEFDGKIIDY